MAQLLITIEIPGADTADEGPEGLATEIMHCADLGGLEFVPELVEARWTATESLPAVTVVEVMPVVALADSILRMIESIAPVMSAAAKEELITALLHDARLRAEQPRSDQLRSEMDMPKLPPAMLGGFVGVKNDPMDFVKITGI